MLDALSMEARRQGRNPSPEILNGIGPIGFQCTLRRHALKGETECLTTRSASEVTTPTGRSWLTTPKPTPSSAGTQAAFVANAHSYGHDSTREHGREGRRTGRHVGLFDELEHFADAEAEREER